MSKPKKMTLTEVRSRLCGSGMSFRKTTAGDLRVNFAGGDEATAYYTDDPEDAFNTAMLMLAHRKLQQAPAGSESVH